jgi:hypothetical protein
VRLRKRTVDKVITEAHWEGFQHGLSDSHVCLSYASTSGLYSYNPIRTIAYGAGHDLAQKLLSDHVAQLEKTRAGGRRELRMPFEYKVAGSVYTECYGEAHLAVRACGSPTPTRPTRA